MLHYSQYELRFPVETFEQYCPGGYHPIHLNDLLNDGQYEILHKLGFGSFSTVWLAQDNQSQRNVSIKVLVANKSKEHNLELQILQRIAKIKNSDHPGRKYLPELLDWFYHEGPNGRHLCIVLEVLGPKLSDLAQNHPDYRLDGRLARRVSRQLLYATDCLHSYGIAHGDIYNGNVVFRLFDLKDSSPNDPLEELGTPLKGKVRRYDGAPIEKGLPAYLVDPAAYRADFSDDIKLIDFGESFFISAPPKLINTPISLHPPELVFQHVLTEAVDIWNLGCTTYELVTGQPPFEGWCNDEDLIPKFQKVVGGVPERWVRDALSSGVLKKKIDDSSAEGYLPLEQQIRDEYFRDYCGAKKDELELGEKEIGLLERYLRKMLVVDPKQRATSQSLLSEKWISKAR